MLLLGVQLQGERFWTHSAEQRVCLPSLSNPTQLLPHGFQACDWLVLSLMVSCSSEVEKQAVKMRETSLCGLSEARRSYLHVLLPRYVWLKSGCFLLQLLVFVLRFIVHFLSCQVLFQLRHRQTQKQVSSILQVNTNLTFIKVGS